MMFFNSSQILKLLGLTSLLILLYSSDGDTGLAGGALHRRLYLRSSCLNDPPFYLSIYLSPLHDLLPLSGFERISRIMKKIHGVECNRLPELWLCCLIRKSSTRAQSHCQPRCWGEISPVMKQGTFWRITVFHVWRSYIWWLDVLFKLIHILAMTKIVW